MLQSAHIFIGKEYSELLEKVGLSFVKHNNKDTYYNHFYNVSAENNGKYSFTKLNLQSSLNNGEETVSWNEKETVDKNSLPTFWSERVFDRILNVANASQGVLYVFIHLPLYKKKSLELVKELCLAIKNSERPVNVDFVGYCEDLFKIIEPKSKDKIDLDKDSVPFIKEMYKELNYTAQQNNMIVIQNRTMNGVSLLNEEDGPEPFYDMIANLSLLFSSHYDKIFSVTNASSLDVIGIGFSSLYFDTFLFAKYLLQKTMLGAINNQSVNNKDVDVNKANATTADILKDKENILSRFITKWNGKEKDNPDYGEIKKEIQDIVERTLKYFNNDKDMTAKAAVLASILSDTQCELFSNSFSSIDNKCYEDLYSEAINYFINEDDVSYYSIVEDEKLINPIEELKKVNRTLVQTEVQIRTLEKQLEGYKDQIEKNEKVKECFVDDGFFQFDDKKFRLLPNIDEEPLKDNYEAHEVKMESVDLRSNFSSIKNQGQQGSCLSFTLTSIFEYMMKVSQQEDCDLSEAFLYYNARNIDENESTNNDNGSRFHPSIESLSKFGIALEKYWPYDDSVYDRRPSDEAYKDAETRKLIKALNVERSVNAVKSALADGYPVAGSFTLYPSFNQNGAYIQMPTQEEMSGENDDNEKDEQMERHARHAMTIVGFSDELQMFLVRNSWGSDWGDRGYCYMPYAYIENNELFNFACIITEVASLNVQKPELKNIPALKINNGDIQIRYYVALASLSIQIEKIKELEKQRVNLLQYLEIQKNLLSDPNARDEFIDANVKSIQEANDDFKKEIKQKETKNEEIFETFKRKRLFGLIGCGVSILLFIVLFFVLNKIKTRTEFSGKIGDYDITMNLEDDNKGKCSGWYYYEKYGPENKLTLKGEYDDKGNMKLKEYNPKTKEYTGVFDGNLQEGKYIGEFENITENTTYDFKVPVYIKTLAKKEGGFNIVLLSLIPLLYIIYALIQFRKYRNEWREERDRLQSIIDANKKRIATNEKRIDAFRHKTFAAWTTITSLCEGQSQLEQIYTKLISLINNLRTWYTEAQNYTEDINFNSSFPNISILNKELVDKYFETEICDSNVCDIDLCKDLDNHQISVEYLSEYKNNLKKELTSRLMNLLEKISFNISEHVASGKFSNIVKDVDVALINNWHSQANIFLHVKSNDRPVIAPNNIVFAPNLNTVYIQLSKKLEKMYASFVESDDNYKMTLASVITLKFEECVTLQGGEVGKTKKK